jgi:hypothetical protein
MIAGRYLFLNVSIKMLSKVEGNYNFFGRLRDPKFCQRFEVFTVVKI